MKKIAIVGGGPGGLFAAMLLGRKCSEMPEITLFEASPRLGGKVLTKQFEAAPVPYEAGAAELYQYGKDPLRLLIKETLGLPVVSMGGRAVVMDGHILRSRDDVERHYGQGTARALAQFDKLAHEARPYGDFYDGGWVEDNDHPLFNRTFEDLLSEIPDQNARRYLKVLIHSDLAAEPHSANALYGIDNYLINDPRYCKLYSIQGGMERLIDALRGEIEVRTRLNAPVERIEKGSDGRYLVTCREGGPRRVEEFDSVVVALPHAWLSNVVWGGARLEAAMNAHLAHYDYPAHYLRISLLFEQPFWREEFNESYFMIDAFGGCCVYDEGARHDTGAHGVLAWLLAGNNAFAAHHLSDERLIEMALESLPAEIAAGREWFVEGRIHRWIGSVSARPGGKKLKHLEGRHVPEPVEHPNLFIVGDYMFDTSINGALDSADFATDMVLEALQIPRATVDDDYFDYYHGDESYEESYQTTFDAEYVASAIEAAWGAKPPYKLLDAGSACGLTLRDFERIRIDARGIENNWYICAQTPKRWKKKNHLGDVRKLPFADDEFDFVYETCLAHVHEADLGQAIRELRRVARRGVLFASVVKDMPAEVIEEFDLLYGVKSLLTGEQWARLFIEHGFAPAIADPKAAASVWRVNSKAYDGSRLFATPKALGLRFFSKTSHPEIIKLPSPSARKTTREAAAL